MAASGTAVLASCAFAFVQLQMLLPTFHLVQVVKAFFCIHNHGSHRITLKAPRHLG